VATVHLQHCRPLVGSAGKGIIPNKGRRPHESPLTVHLANRNIPPLCIDVVAPEIMLVVDGIVGIRLPKLLLAGAPMLGCCCVDLRRTTSMGMGKRDKAVGTQSRLQRCERAERGHT
jgi:hypothetical protein